MDIQSAMDTESHPTRDSDFPHSHWMDMPPYNPSQQSPPLPEYQGFNYGSSPVLPLDSSFGMSIPPPYSSLALTMPSHPWPSMLTSQHHHHHHHQPPHYQEAAGLPPMHTIPPSISPAGPIPPPRKSSTGGTNPRRTLTDEDRRRMCLYHEENKTAKQTDIGALFGVERSTVSKVLRQKEKYLNPDDGSRSPIKRAKGRVPDIEKALSNWARNYQAQGFALSDEAIKEKAKFFATSCCPDGREKILSRAWLEKFKQKNSLTGSKSRKSSFDTVKSDSNSPIRLSIDSTLASAMQSPTSVLSPISPTATGFATPSPLSPTHNQENMKNKLADSLAELAEYQNMHSKNANSLEATASLSNGVTSPTSTLVSDSPFTPTSQSRISPTDVNPNRPRSQTLPVIDTNMMQNGEHKDQMSSQAALQHALSVPIPESPLEHERNHESTAVLEAPNIIKRNRSNPEIKTKSIYPPLFLSTSSTVSPVSSPGSPTQDEARNALELVMNYFQNQPNGLGAQEYVTIGKLMERLELTKGQPTLPGGLTRIDEHEDAPHLLKKRSIHSLG